MVKCSLLTTSVSLTIGNVILLTIVLFKSFSKAGCANTVTHQERIVGGRTADTNKFPFVSAIIVTILKVSFLQCGSSIISVHWAISATHCIKLLEEAAIPLPFIYIAAGHKEWSKGTRHKVTKMIKNPYYDETRIANDHSLFKVKEPFNMNTEIAVILASPNYKYVSNSSASVFGWGYNESKIIQDTLYFVDVIIFSREFCDRMWKKAGITTTADMFCAGTYEGGYDACQFDSGGPIVQNGILIGVVSWGGICGEKTEPGVYSKTSYFISWLQSVEQAEGEKIGYRVKDNI